LNFASEEDYIAVKRKAGRHFPADPEGKLKAYFEATYEDQTDFKLHRLASVNLESLSTEISKRTYPSGNIQGVAAKYYNTALILRMVNPVVSYSETPQTLIKENGAFICAEISALVRAMDKRNVPVPIHVSFYWSDKYRDWVPWELAANSYAGLSLLF
jgi:hypothetical protein